MKQRFPTPEQQDPLAASYRAWSGRLGVWILLGLLAAMFGLVSLLVFTTPLSRNDLGLLGGLRVVADEDTTIFVGDRWIGSGTVDVTWNELLGATGRPALAIGWPASKTDADLAAALADENATIVWQDEGAMGTHRGRQNANVSFRELLLERSGGSLDHVFLIECEFPNAPAEWRYLLLPIRTRKSDDMATGYFPQAGTQGVGSVNRGMIPSRRDHATFELKLSVTRGAPPSELAARLSSVQLWTPSTN